MHTCIHKFHKLHTRIQTHTHVSHTSLHTYTHYIQTCLHACIPARNTHTIYISAYIHYTHALHTYMHPCITYTDYIHTCTHTYIHARMHALHAYIASYASGTYVTFKTFIHTYIHARTHCVHTSHAHLHINKNKS